MSDTPIKLVDMLPMDMPTWLEYGIAMGWCSEVVCNTHDGLPLTPSEGEEFEEGGDPCVPAVRLYAQ